MREKVDPRTALHKQKRNQSLIAGILEVFGTAGMPSCGMDDDAFLMVMKGIIYYLVVQPLQIKQESVRIPEMLLNEKIKKIIYLALEVRV